MDPFACGGDCIGYETSARELWLPLVRRSVWRVSAKLICAESLLIRARPFQQVKPRMRRPACDVPRRRLRLITFQKLKLRSRTQRRRLRETRDSGSPGVRPTDSSGPDILVEEVGCL